MGMIEVGQYVRTPAGVGMIFGKTESQYEIALVERDEEVTFSAPDLIAWTPEDCERVTDIDNEDSPVGIVVEAGEEISQVVWKNLRRQAAWGNSYLEPAWID